MVEHDSGYKLLFSHPRMVEDLVRGSGIFSWTNASCRKVGRRRRGTWLQRCFGSRLGEGHERFGTL